MIYVSKTSVYQIMMNRTSNKEYVSRTLASPEFGPRNLHANLSGNGVIDASFYAMIWTTTD
jgi:uncharacterized protein (DUF736 family)